MACYFCVGEPGPRPGETLEICVQREISSGSGTLLPDADLTVHQKNDSGHLMFGPKSAPSAYKGIVPRLRHVDDVQGQGSKRPRVPGSNPPDAA